MGQEIGYRKKGKEKQFPDLEEDDKIDLSCWGELFLPIIRNRQAFLHLYCTPFLRKFIKMVILEFLIKRYKFFVRLIHR